MKKNVGLIASLLIFPFLASCNGGSTEYKVSIPDTNGVIITPQKAIKGKDYVGTIKMAQDVDPDHLLPAALDKVTSGNKEFKTTDYTYTLKEDNLSAIFKIPAANIVGDVDIYLSPVFKEFYYKVSEEEFNSAIKFEGIEYAQALCALPDSSNAFPYVSYEFSPTAYLEKEMKTPNDPDFGGTFVTKDGESYSKYIHDPETGSKWEKRSGASKSDFKEPTYLYDSYIKNYINGCEYKDFKYDSVAKTYSASKDIESANYEFSLRFENKKMVNYVFKATVIDENSKLLAETETFVLTLSITYEEKTPRIYKNLPTNTRRA